MKYQVRDDNGKLLDAHFNLDASGIDYHSRGGSQRTGTQRNADYAKGLRNILNRLSMSNIRISRIWVNSSRVQDMPIEERLVLSGEEFESDPESAFGFISSRMVPVGQSRGAKSGNRTKKIKIEFKDRFPMEETGRIALLLTGENKIENSDASLINNLYDAGKSRDKDFEKHYQLRLNELENTDGRSNQAQSRKEQGILRAILFKAVGEAKCAICHRTFPADLMVAAHIKPRSKCSPSERKNSNVVMPVCKVGCDDFFEKGYVIIDSKGFTRVNDNKNYSSELKIILTETTGKKCTHYNEGTAQFFTYKRENLCLT